MVERLALDDPEWIGFVENEPLSMPFHHPAWASTVADYYGFEAFALALRGQEGDRKVVAGLPVIEIPGWFRRGRRWSSLPFTDVCPGLVSDGDGEGFVQAIGALMSESGVREMEVRGSVPGVPNLVSARYVQHVLHLEEDPTAVEHRFRSSVRRNVRAARSGPLRVRRVGGGSEAVGLFYRLHLMTRRRLGLPAQPRRFFQALADNVLAGGLGHITVVETHNKPVAAAIFLTWNGSVVYKYGASDPAAWSLRPNNLLFAEEIEAACLRGDRTVHFGRTDIQDDGLRRFKAGWGAEELPLTYFQFGMQHAEGFGPPPLMRSLVRHSPLFVVRSLGEALYRYLA